MPIRDYNGGPPIYRLPSTQGDYPDAAFPPLIGDAVREASRNSGVPIELPAQAALAALSLGCQPFVNVQSPGFPPAPCSAYLLTLSNTSGGKTLILDLFLRAIRAVERKANEEADAGVPTYQAEMKIWRDDDRRLSKEYLDAEPGSEDAKRVREQRLRHEVSRPSEPRGREMRFNELSPQALRDMLVVHRSIGILSPEGGPVLNGMTFSQPALLCSYWSGEDPPVALASGNRKPDGARVCVLVMLQNNKFAEYMKSRGDDAFATGLLARFLPAFPTTADQFGRKTIVDDVPEPKLDLFNEKLATILRQSIPAPDNRIVLQMTDRAKLYWKMFKEAVNDELICSDYYSQNVKSFFRKLGEHAARIAALFHYFVGSPGDISANAMKSAIALCEWYALEFIRIFSPLSPSQQQKNVDAAHKLHLWLQDASANPSRYSKLSAGQYTERDLKNYSAIRNDPTTLAMAIDTLQRQGLIATAYGKKGGRVVFYPPYMAQHFQQAGFGVQPMNYNTAHQFIMPVNIPPTWQAYASNSLDNQFGSGEMPFNNPPNQGPERFETILAYQGTPTGGVSPPQHEQSHAGRHDSPRMTMEGDSDELDAVKRHIETKAMEGGLGQVSMSVKHRSG